MNKYVVSVATGLLVGTNYMTTTINVFNATDTKDQMVSFVKKEMKKRNAVPLNIGVSKPMDYSAAMNMANEISIDIECILSA